MSRQLKGFFAIGIIEIHEVIPEFARVFQELDRDIQHLRQPVSSALAFEAIPSLRNEARFRCDQGLNEVGVQGIGGFENFIPVLSPATNEIVVLVAASLELKVVDTRWTR